MKNFISKTWVLWIYIFIEICFQLYLRNSIKHIERINIELLELIGRLLFSMSVMVFLWSGLQFRNYFFVSIVGVFAFFISSQIYPTIQRQLSPEMQTKLMSKFLWGASEGVFSDPTRLNSAMTLAFSVYDTNGDAVVSKMEGAAGKDFHYHFMNKIIPNAMKMAAKKVAPHKPKLQRLIEDDLMSMSKWRKIEEAPFGNDNKLLRIVIAEINDKLIKIVEKKMKIAIANDRPIGTAIKLSQTYYDEALFKSQFNEWIMSEVLESKGIRGGKDFALKALIMLPLGFFFSSLGMLFNGTAILIKGSEDAVASIRITALVAMVLMWFFVFMYGISAIPPALEEMHGVYWLTPVFAITKLLGVISI